MAIFEPAGVPEVIDGLTNALQFTAYQAVIMNQSFVPANFDVPETITTDSFCLTVLSPAVCEIDYEAVMSSKTRLRKVFDMSTEWPHDSMTLEDNFNCRHLQLICIGCWITVCNVGNCIACWISIGGVQESGVLSHSTEERNM